MTYGDDWKCSWWLVAVAVAVILGVAVLFVADAVSR